MDETQQVDVVEHFYGVYLLYCSNPKYAGRVYIGYTVDPNRRIQQHNKGRKFGGAWRTSNRGPWVMVMIIHGFPNDISALRFEWAWQHPQSSRRLQHVQKKKAKEKVYDFTIRVLSEMLQVGPWKRLPLTVRWLNEEFYRELPRVPPLHMPICNGPVISKKVPQRPKNDGSPLKTPSETSAITTCYCCNQPIEENGSPKMTCLNPDCTLTSHVICLSQRFLRPGEYVPIEGKCPKCDLECLWGDLVRKLKGCYQNLDVRVRAEAGDDFYGSDSE